MTTKEKSAPSLAPATMSEFEGVRYLHLGTIWVQGAMRLSKPHEIELEYVKRMMVWMLFRPQEQLTEGHAVQLGMGSAAITRFCHRNMGMNTTVVEINPTVVMGCRMWFRLPPDNERLRVVKGDARAYVSDPANAGTADVLNVDLYDQDAACPALDDQDFYDACHRTLADGGVMTVNLFGRDASFERSAARIAQAFGRASVLSVQPTKEGNTVVVGLKNVPVADTDTLEARAQNIETRFNLPARKWLRMIRPLPDNATPA